MPSPLLWNRKLGTASFGNEHVETAVVVVVGKRDAHAFADVVEKPGARRDVLERAVAPIAIEVVWQSLEVPRMTVDAQSRDRIAARTGWCPADQLHVVDDQKVQTGRRCRSRTSRRQRPSRRSRCPSGR